MGQSTELINDKIIQVPSNLLASNLPLILRDLAKEFEVKSLENKDAEIKMPVTLTINMQGLNKYRVDASIKWEIKSKYSDVSEPVFIDLDQPDLPMDSEVELMPLPSEKVKKC